MCRSVDGPRGCRHPEALPDGDDVSSVHDSRRGGPGRHRGRPRQPDDARPARRAPGPVGAETAPPRGRPLPAAHHRQLGRRHAGVALQGHALQRRPAHDHRRAGSAARHLPPAEARIERYSASEPDVHASTSLRSAGSAARFGAGSPMYSHSRPRRVCPHQYHGSLPRRPAMAPSGCQKNVHDVSEA